MARVCDVTGTKPLVGNRVSHSNRKSKVRLLPNLQHHRFWLPSENRWISLRVTTSAMKTIDKKGVEAIVRELRAAGQKV